MSIFGGAVLTAMMGKLSDVSGEIRLAMVIPLLCFIIVAAFASRMQKRSSRSKA
jgi:FHS family L-fucose permease-like MFS transporter